MDKGDLLSSGDCCQLVNIALVLGAFVAMIVVFTECLLCVGSASRSLHALASGGWLHVYHVEEAVHRLQCKCPQARCPRDRYVKRRTFSIVFISTCQIGYCSSEQSRNSSQSHSQGGTQHLHLLTGSVCIDHLLCAAHCSSLTQSAQQSWEECSHLTDEETKMQKG